MYNCLKHSKNHDNSCKKQSYTKEIRSLDLVDVLQIQHIHFKTPITEMFICASKLCRALSTTVFYLTII